MGDLISSPDWVTKKDLEYYVKEFTRAGFNGGINYYRNMDRNWELMALFADQVIEIPALFRRVEKIL